MQIATYAQPRFIVRLVSHCAQLAKRFLIVPSNLHRWCLVAIAATIAALCACFIAYGYVEKHHVINSFFYDRLEFSFVDGGYPETLGYALELLSCALFATFARMHYKTQWYAWSAILFVTFLDDSFRLHENIGHYVVSLLNFSDVAGDLIGFASTGLISAVLWFAGASRITSVEDFSAYLVFTAYYTILIFFGVGIDAVHAAIGQHMSQTLFTLIEDGGELVTTAIISLSALGMWLRQKRAVDPANESIDVAYSKI